MSLHRDGAAQIMGLNATASTDASFKCGMRWDKDCGMMAGRDRS